MKNIILIFALFFATTLFAQKTIYIFNYSSYNIEIGNFQSKDIGSTEYPQYRSLYSGSFIIAPMVIYKLENPSMTRFPFQSVNSNPYIDYWSRFINSTSTGSGPIASSNLDFDVLANPQIFYFLKFQVRDPLNNNTLGGGNLGLSPYDSFIISGNGWRGDYTTNDDETILFFLDN